MKNVKNVLFVAVLFISASVLGQVKITGEVIDETNQPLPGASIVVKGTTNGTSTNFDGKFTLQAEASSRGFSTTFARFQQLKNRGLSQEQARGIYQTAGSTISQAESIGRELDLSTLEEATLGDTNASKRLQRISAELQSKQGIQLGAAKINDEVTGLIAD